MAAAAVAVGADQAGLLDGIEDDFRYTIPDFSVGPQQAGAPGSRRPPGARRHRAPVSTPAGAQTAVNRASRRCAATQAGC